MKDIEKKREINEKTDEFRRKLENKDEFFAAIVDNAYVIVAGLDLQATILFVNKYTEIITGYAKDELIGKNWSDLLAPEKLYPDLCLDYQKSKDTGCKKEVISPIITKDGTEKIIHWRKSQCCIDGDIVGTIAVGIDITQHMDIEKAYDESENKYRLLTEISPVCTFQMSHQGEVIYMSHAWKTITGSEPEEALGDKWMKFLHPLDRQQAVTDWNIIRGNEMSHYQEYRFLHKESKKIIWLLSRIVPQKSFNDKLLGYIGTFTDISAQKEVEETLAAAKQKAEETDKLKSSLLANMSHELRTPMTGILGFAKILTEELIEPEYIEIAGRIFKSGKRLMTTLNSILDLAELESNNLKTNNEIIILSEAVKLIGQQYQKIAEEKQLFYDLIIHDSQVRIKNDMRMLNIVVSNILDNAVKYTDKGGIIVEIDHMEFQGMDWAVIKVKDTGIGIQEGKKNIVFEEFRQVSEGIGREYEGTGLGLTLVKKFIDLMGGRILLKSEAGKGSTFTVCLPVNEKPVAGMPEISKNVSYELKHHSDELPEILLVEDNDMNVMVTELFLKKMFRIDHAKSGASALKKVSEKQYALILMDINLGVGMNGVEAAKKIKHMPGYEKINIIAVTGYAMAGDREHFINEGFYEYLAKPFDKQDLLNLIRSSI
jgi:PAS domain S-box-containing protein